MRSDFFLQDFKIRSPLHRDDDRRHGLSRSNDGRVEGVVLPDRLEAPGTPRMIRNVAPTSTPGPGAAPVEDLSLPAPSRSPPRQFVTRRSCSGRELFPGERVVWALPWWQVVGCSVATRGRLLCSGTAPSKCVPSGDVTGRLVGSRQGELGIEVGGVVTGVVGWENPPPQAAEEKSQTWNSSPRGSERSSSRISPVWYTPAAVGEKGGLLLLR